MRPIALDLVLLAIQLVGLLLALLLLFKGGDLLVEGASALATLLGVAPLIVGLTVVAYGTSFPELVVSTTAALQGNPGIAVGNVVGSNIANILLILGLAAAVAPMAVPVTVLRRDARLLVLVAGLMCLLAAVSVTTLTLGAPFSIDRAEGAVLLLAFAVYLIFFLRLAFRQAAEHAEVPNGSARSGVAVDGIERAGAPGSTRTSDPSSGMKQNEAVEGSEDLVSAAKIGTKRKATFLLLLGLGGVIAGGYLLVGSASGMARQFGISEEVIGLTIVAVGTSIPELVTSLIAAMKRRPSIALGNVIGSNIFNGLLILGLAATIAPLGFSPGMVVDFVIMLAVTMVLVLMLRTGRVLSRIEGVVLAVGYAAYLGSLLVR